MSGYMYSCREMARQLDTNVSRLREMRAQGIGPAHVLVHGRILYPETALWAWIDQA